jgi:hypothetical protein
METIEYRTFDKSDWGKGPWNDEPDKKQWLNTATGYPCLIVRNHSGSLCGYVGVPEGHPCYQRDYQSVDVEIHGGLTFADACAQDGDESRHICHKASGDDRVWWLGFDCAHLGDISPAHDAWGLARGGVVGFNDELSSYKTVGYVTRQVESLARQLKALESGV